MTFVKGESGNPAGRPIGSRNRKALIIEGLLEGDAEGITQRAIELALRGDPTALRLCLERIYPRGRDRPVPFPLPPIEKAADLVVAANRICSGIGTGEISPNEALALLRVVDWTAKFLRLAQAENKLEQMESQVQDLTARLAAAESTSGKQAGQPVEARPAGVAAAATNTSAEQPGRPAHQDAFADGLAARHPPEAPNTSEKQPPQPRRDGPPPTNTRPEQAGPWPPPPDAGRLIPSPAPHPWQFPPLATPENTSQIQARRPPPGTPHPIGMLSHLFVSAGPADRRSLWPSWPGDLPPLHRT